MCGDGGVDLKMPGYIDEEMKRILRDEYTCNIVGFNDDKTPKIVTDALVLRELQNDTEFKKLLPVKQWGVTQTINSNIILANLNTSQYDLKLNKIFTRTRRTYKNGEPFVSKHGIIKVLGATHADCVMFCGLYHQPGGLELSAENQSMIVGGHYNCLEKEELAEGEDMPTSSWYVKTDMHLSPIIEIDKEKLVELFRGQKKIKSNFMDGEFWK